MRFSLRSRLPGGQNLTQTLHSVFPVFLRDNLATAFGAGILVQISFVADCLRLEVVCFQLNVIGCECSLIAAREDVVKTDSCSFLTSGWHHVCLFVCLFSLIGWHSPLLSECVCVCAELQPAVRILPPQRSNRESPLPYSCQLSQGRSRPFYLPLQPPGQGDGLRLLTNASLVADNGSRK